jgi:hypothetical protein
MKPMVVRVALMAAATAAAFAGGVLAVARHLLLPAVLLLAALGATACDEKLRDVTGPSSNLQPTFSSIQAEIFDKAGANGSQACTACHTNVGRTPTSGLNLTPGNAYAALVNVASAEKPALMRVLPGDPDNSYVIHKLEGTPAIVGRQMPRNGPPYLTSGEILVIRRWIALGAKND